MSLKKFLTWGVALGVFVALCAAVPATTRAQSGNLLQNPGLNLPYDNNKQATGWGRWFQEIPKPDDASALQYAIAPNFSAETNPSGSHPELVLDGNASQHIGRQYDPWIGGIYQFISNVPPGSEVRFCTYSRLYAQNKDYGKGEPSINALNGRSQVGVFLDGEAIWDNPNIVWSGQANPHDTWQNICVTAGPVGASGKVTVITRNDWRDSGAIHLDAWWDQAELVIMGAQPTATPQAQPQPQLPQATQQPQPLPAVPDATGSVVHTIVSGDTLFGLSLQYNVPIEQIYQLNGLNSQSILSIGQKVIIKGGPGAPAVQPTAAPPAQPTAAPAQAATQSAPDAAVPTAAAQPAQPAAAPTASAANDISQLCVFSFEDANGDGLLDEGESPVPDTKFTVVNGQNTAVAEHVSTDQSTAHCITDLAPGQYKVNVKPAPNATATSDKLWNVSLTSGSSVNVNFGSRGGESSSSTSTSETGATDSASGGSNIGGLLGGAVGLILLLAAGVIGAFVIARRRA
jgi:LysM repeat protein